MPSFVVSTIILAPRSRIWSVWLDVDHWPQWTTTVTAIRHQGANPLKLGSVVGIDQPRLRPAQWRVTELDESAGLFIWASRNLGVTATATHRAEPVENGTRVTFTMEFSGLLAPLVRRFYGKLTRQYMVAELEGLKAYCES